MNFKNHIIGSAIITLVIVLLIIISFYNYLIFHAFVEGFSIAIAVAMFIISWNTKKYSEHFGLASIGIAYLYVGTLDFLHVLAYQGMGVFSTDQYTTQLWISARYIESISILLAMILIGRKVKKSYNLILLVYFIITSTVILSIFYYDIFPLCHIPGEGLTNFKIISEYIISAILVATIVILLKKRKQIEKRIFNDLILALVFTIIAELSFTFYVDMYEISNLIGHLSKLASFYFIYRSIVYTGLKNP
ncbi:MAG: hybrid sensor histidine kinase/response regulator, partial [Marinilabiliales bacterium]